MRTKGFPGGSDGKESVCNAGDLGWIPGLGRLNLTWSWRPAFQIYLKPLNREAV